MSKKKAARKRMVSKGLGAGGHHKRGRRSDGWWKSHTSNEWLTPKWILDQLGSFDLDPCASIERPWPTAKRHYTIEDDGLVQPWEGLVWCNPPYGREAARWLAKLVEHVDGIAFLFARTETEMFHRYVWPYAHAVFFLRGRVSFHRPDGTVEGNAGGPSVLIAYGDEADARLMKCGVPGIYLSLRLATRAGGWVIFPGRCTGVDKRHLVKRSGSKI